MAYIPEENLDSGGGGRRFSASGTVFLIVALVIAVLGGVELFSPYGISGRRARIREIQERNAQNVVQIFWDSMRGEKWMSASRLLTPETIEQLKAFAEEQTGVAEAQDALEVFHDRLYPQMLALKYVSGCGLKDHVLQNGVKKIEGVCFVEYYDEETKKRLAARGRERGYRGIEKLRIPLSIVFSMGNSGADTDSMLIESLQFGTPIGIHALGPSGVQVPARELVSPQ